MVRQENKMHFGISLKKLNRILRWTGWRLFVGLDDDFLQDNNLPPKTYVGFEWYGWSFVKNLKEDLKE